MERRVVAGDRTLRRYLLILVALLVLLAALIFAYYVINRPPQIVSGGEQVTNEDQDFRFVLAIYGFEGDLLSKPSFACIGPDGRIYVADTMKNRVVVFDSRGRYVGLIKGEASGQYTLKWPISVAVADDGRIFVLSKQDRKIIVFDQNYTPINVITFTNVIPTALAIKNDRLYVGTDKAIMIGTLDGRPVTQIGRFGKKPGQFDLIGGLAIGDDGTIYVADSLNYRVQAIDEKTGKAKWTYGQPLPPEKAIMYQGKERKFGLPSSIALDERGRLYVVDGLSSEVVVLDAKTGEKIKTISDIGHKEGLFYYPDGIYYAQGGLVAVADKFNDRVQIFRVPTPGILGAIPSWVPWLALLPLALLLLWLLFAPRVRFIADEDFLVRLAQSDVKDALQKSLKKLYVLEEVRGRYLKEFDRLTLVALEIDEDRAREIMENFKLAENQSKLLSGAAKLRGRKTLFAEDETFRLTTEENFEIATMTYDQLLESTLGGAREDEQK
jgi:DNA-binding beta-propeller fold protein YncE